MKVLSRAVLAAAMVFAAPALHAQTSLIFAAGLTMPLGDTGDALESGYHATIGLGIKPPLAPLGARIEGMFNSHSYKNALLADASARILALTANATFAAAPQVYAIGGLGFYNMGCSGDVCSGVDSENKAGFNIGGGFNIPLTGLGVFVEGRLHIISTEGGSTKIFPITVGMKF